MPTIEHEIVNIISGFKPLALKKTGCLHTAKDLLQDVALKVLIRKDQFTHKDNLKAYISVSINNTHSNYLRSQNAFNKFKDESLFPHFDYPSIYTKLLNDKEPVKAKQGVLNGVTGISERLEHNKIRFEARIFEKGRKVQLGRFDSRYEALKAQIEHKSKQSTDKQIPGITNVYERKVRKGISLKVYALFHRSKEVYLGTAKSRKEAARLQREYEDRKKAKIL